MSLDEWDWERQTTKPIAYNFDILFNDGKNIACVQNRFKICCALEDFAHNNDVILQERLLE